VAASTAAPAAPAGWLERAFAGLDRARSAPGVRQVRPYTGWLLGILLVAFLLGVGSDFALFITGTVIIYAISALGLDLLMGRAGQVSIGNAALMAVGGYLTAIVSTKAWGFFPIPVLVAGVAGAAVGFIVGLPALRLRGIYLALATLALHFIVQFGADRYQQKTGQISGLSPEPPSFAGFQFQYGKSYVLLLAVALGITILVLRNVYRHAPGRMWMGIRESELAAAAIGVNATRWKLIAFVTSSAIIACAGSFFAYYTQSVSSETFNLDFAITFIVMIIIGGVGSIAGAIVGATIVTMAPYALTTVTDHLPSSPLSGWLHDNIFYLNNGLYGLLVLFFLLYQPEGAVPGLRRLGRWAVARLVSATRPVHVEAAPEDTATLVRHLPSKAATPLLRVEDLGVTYRTGARAVDGIELEVPEGAIVALLGRNGAGKTSTLRAISGFFGSERVRVDGRVLVDGRNVAGLSPVRAAKLGLVLVPERDKVFASLRVSEHLRIADRDRGEALREEPLFAPLWTRLDSPAGLLSGGERQLLSLSTAWLLRPRLLMIDELSLGLAPVMIRRLVAGVRELRDKHGMTFLLVEQNAAAALEVADWLYVMEAGKIVAQGTPDEVARHNLLTPVSAHA
jgi:ABC-type branched-subunit amino acid transport system permease subunit/ABC-type branched-subunit amino acid transport system ATPase component